MHKEITLSMRQQKLEKSSSPEPELKGTAKRDEIFRLMGVLNSDLEKICLSPPHRNDVLAQLRGHIRTFEDAKLLSTKEGIRTLCRHSFDGASLLNAREALRCLANILLLDSKARQILVDLGYAGKAADRLQNDHRDDELLISRILFLLTYDTDLNFDDLLEHHQLAESINQNILRHSTRDYAKATRTTPVLPLLPQSLSETLKLLFNLTQLYPHQAPNFTKSLPHILKILTHVHLPTPPLQPPVTYLINALLNLDLGSAKTRLSANNPIFPMFDPRCNADNLIGILNLAVRDYKDDELERLAAPLTTLIRKIFEVAPDAVRAHMKKLLLPSLDERSRPLGTGDTLAARLLQLSTSPVAPSLRENVSNLLFELSGQDATSFVRNVGYGFASGFLISHDLPVPENAMETWSTGDSSTTLQDPGERITMVEGEEINPVTGQKRSMEEVDEGPEMTEEEKEREAERLFVLFERLKATGVVNVRNPVEQALQEGRFEEVDD